MASKYCLALCLSVFVALGVWADTTVRVGVYDYPPYAMETEAGFTGPLVELVDLLNQNQSHYQFQLVPTTPRRRYIDFSNQAFDLIFFEQRIWGWQEYDLIESERLVSGGEIYIAHAEAGRDQSYFNNLNDKRLLGVNGYHYGIADFNSDPTYLTEKLSMHLVTSQSKVIELIAQDKADVGIVDKAYLHYYLRSHPEYASDVYLSERYDQRYQHGALLRDDGPIPIDDFNQMIINLKQSQEFFALLESYQLQGLTPEK